jgi:hypothetical protein
MHVCACTSPRALVPKARTHARTHACTHRTVGSPKRLLIAFPLQQWFAIAPQCYVIGTLSVLFVYVGYSSSPWLYVRIVLPNFSHGRFFFTLLQHHVSNLSRYFISLAYPCLIFRNIFQYSWEIRDSSVATANILPFDWTTERLRLFAVGTRRFAVRRLVQNGSAWDKYRGLISRGHSSRFLKLESSSEILCKEKSGIGEKLFLCLCWKDVEWNRNWLRDPIAQGHGVISQKNGFFSLTALRISELKPSSLSSVRNKNRCCFVCLEFKTVGWPNLN